MIYVAAAIFAVFAIYVLSRFSVMTYRRWENAGSDGVHTVRRKGWAADVPIAGMPATPDFDMPVNVSQEPPEPGDLFDRINRSSSWMEARRVAADAQLLRLRRAAARNVLDNEPFFDLLEESRAAGISVGATMQEAVPDHPDNLPPHENRQRRHIRLKDSNKQEPNGH